MVNIVIISALIRKFIRQFTNNSNKKVVESKFKLFVSSRCRQIHYRGTDHVSVFLRSLLSWEIQEITLTAAAPEHIVCFVFFPSMSGI